MIFFSESVRETDMIPVQGCCVLLKFIKRKVKPMVLTVQVIPSVFSE